jgi:hypothetical protein
MNEREQEEKLLKELASLPKIKPGSKEMEAHLSAGYPDIGTREHALELIKTRKENPALVPWEVEQRAIAFLAALDAKPAK